MHTVGAIAELRYAYFAQSGETAGRYAVGFDDVVVHLWRLRRRYGRVGLRRVRHMDDLVHVVACTGGVEQAWRDLIDRHESVLVRRCAERAGEMEALLQVRRALARLRAKARERIVGPGTLGGYAGAGPLRAWLVDRALADLTPPHSVWCSADVPGRRASLRRSMPVLRLEDPAQSEVTSLPFPRSASGE